MSYIEFQISVPALLAAQRNTLLSSKAILCSPVPITVGPVQIVLDRIEFGNNAIRHNEADTFPTFYEDHGETLPTPITPTGFKTQITQDVTVFVSSLNDILSRPNQPPLISVPVSGTLVFELEFYSLVDDCFIQVKFVHFEPGPLPFLPPNFNPNNLPITIDQIVQAVDQRLSTAIPSPALPAGLGKMQPGVKFMNAGVSVDTQLQILAFRIQIGGSSSYLDIPWGNFYKGNFEDRLQGRDWSLSIDAGFIEISLQVMVEEALRKVKVDHLKTFPRSQYSHSNGKATFTLDVLAIYDLPDPLGHVESDPKLPIELSINTPNWLTVDFDLSEVLDESDFYIQMASAFLHLLGIPVESILMALIGSAAMDMLAGTPLENCKQLSTTHIQCNNNVRVPQVPGAVQTTLTDLLVFDNAISLAGTLLIQNLSLASLSTEVHEYQKDVPKITCGPAGMSLVAAFQNDPRGFEIFHAKGFIENSGTAPLFLCSLSVINDPLGAFPPASVRPDRGQAFLTISLDMPIPPPGYYDNPYPCDLLVTTSAGTRLLRFGNLPLATQQDLDHIAAELLVEIGNCEQLMDPWFLHHQGYNPQWSPRPPEGLIAEHLWQVVINGLPEGQTASLVNAAGEELVRTSARAGTALRLIAVVAPGEAQADAAEITILNNAEQAVPALHIGQDALALDLSPASQTSQDTEGQVQGLEVGQTLLLRLGSIPLAGECRQLAPFRLESSLSLVAVTNEGLSAFNFDDPHRPLPVRSWSIDGLRGALNWQGGLLTYGDMGFGRIDRLGVQTPLAVDCPSLPVLEAAADPEGLYALTAESLEIYSPQLCRLSSTPLPDGRGMIRAGGMLVISSAAGLGVYDTSDLRQPISLPSLESIYVTALHYLPGQEAGSFLAVLEDGTARSFRWDGTALQQTASFSQAPWFAETLRLGALLVRIGADRKRLDLYQFGETQTF